VAELFVTALATGAPGGTHEAGVQVNVVPETGIVTVVLNVQLAVFDPPAVVVFQLVVVVRLL
jgi:hypothetical protein